MKQFLYFSALLLSGSLYAQQPACSCAQVIQKLITKVETEYPGFSAKTKDQSFYNELKENLISQAGNASSEVCPAILKKYMDLFKDPHLWVNSNGTSVSTNGDASANRIAIDIPDFSKKIQLSKDKYEGIWANENYTFGIKKTTKDEYTGFIIDAKSSLWKPKDIKFKLVANGEYEYALLDRSQKKGKYTLHEDAILFLEGIAVSLVKQMPKPAISATQIEDKLKELEGFYFKRLTAKTSILKLPSFEYQHLQTIDNLITQNKPLLEESENLIIDLRNNPGGTTDAYQKLLPYISGKSIRHAGAEFLATQTYIDNLEAYKKTLDKNVSTEGTDQQIKKLKEHLGSFINFNASGDSVAYTESIDLASKSPKQIIILANKETGSSAEYFLFIAKQSRKVKIFGIPSYGALDYGNAFMVDFGCADYQVFMPTYRALRLPDYPIDNIGIQPDIYLDPFVKDWQKFAVDYLEN